MSEEELFTEWVGTGYDAYKINYKKEYERLHSIIKEVREYITYARTPRTIYESGYGKGTCVEICMEHLLEILDKESE